MSTSSTSEISPTSDLFDVELPRAPYPGLRPFSREDWPIFFGREAMTDDVVNRLLENHFVFVHGESGCGKSSLIRAGVLVQLEQQYTRGGSSWRTCTSLPGTDPIGNLADSLSKLCDGSPESSTLALQRLLIRGRSAAAPLTEIMCKNEKNHLCILIDQFEEIFSSREKGLGNDARIFIDILIGLREEAIRRASGLAGSIGDTFGISVILTMRSEFLGRCTGFRGLAETVNATQYLLPPMDRSALLRAIREPAHLYEGHVTRELAERLITEAVGNNEQLPLIQHGLRLLWEQRVVQTDSPQEDPHRNDLAATPNWILSSTDYNGQVTLEELLDSHINRAILVLASKYDDKKFSNMVQFLFRALTDINAEGQAIRRPQLLSELSRTIFESENPMEHPMLLDTLAYLAKEEHSFLRLEKLTRDKDDWVIDIAHEALIRCWRKICLPVTGWLHKEFQDGLHWKSLLQQAEMWDKNRDHLLSNATTVEHSAWLKTIPSAHWAQRYGGQYDLVDAFIKASQIVHDPILFEEQLEKERIKIRNELKNEDRTDIRAQLRSELEIKLSQQVREEVKEELRSSMNTEVRLEAWKEFSNKYLNDHKTALKTKLTKDIKNELRVVLLPEVKAELREELNDETPEASKDLFWPLLCSTLLILLLALAIYVFANLRGDALI